MVAKHWRSIKFQDKYLSECFAQPPLIAFKRQSNIRDGLIKSKIPPKPKPYPERQRKGMSKCGKNCTACSFIIQGEEVRIDAYNSIYLIQCKK